MIKAFYSGVSGAKSFQTRLDVSANNIANANTPGFRADRSTFADLVYSGLSAAEGDNSDLKSGSGVKVADISSSLEEGTFEDTGRSYDVAILGEGYFCLRDDGGSTYFTRAGDFFLKKNGDSYSLATVNGDVVLNDKLEAVTLAEPTADVRFEGPAQQSNENSGIINLAIFSFQNPYALAKDGYGRLTTTTASGEGTLYYGAQIRQGALEGSNVDMAAEMATVIQSQRGFQFGAKVIQTADEMESIANSLRS